MKSCLWICFLACIVIFGVYINIEAESHPYALFFLVGLYFLLSFILRVCKTLFRPAGLAGPSKLQRSGTSVITSRKVFMPRDTRPELPFRL